MKLLTCNIHSCNYSNRNDALEHAKSLEGKWGMKHDNDRIVAKQCRVGSCGAKWKVKTWTRKDDAATVDYVLMACLTHDHFKSCKVAQSSLKLICLKQTFVDMVSNIYCLLNTDWLTN